MAFPERLLIGYVIGVFGVRGELKIQIESDFPERFNTLKRVFACGREYAVERSRLHKGLAILKLEGLDDATAAGALDECPVEVALAEAVPLGPAQYFYYQVIGLQVETVGGERLGAVTDILQTGANDVYVVTTARGDEILLPAIAQVVKAIDVEQGRMVVELMDGMR
ncbi:MAG: 16S rRNA processing protein RimM [Chloroflexi bacterium]|nr:16S rRNA processing protein RimM [Chloroflexota bacterium]MBI3734016.1 16S rRNA processing protein RimM [Chloroflexota bacterium]